MSDLKALLSDWPALSRRLDEALDLEPGKRLAWVDALSEPPSFRQALAELLAGADGATSATIDSPRLRLVSDDDDRDSATLLASGTRVGPYRLLRELGHGGMGVVWLAAGSGIGLANVRSRMWSLYGTAGALTLEAHRPSGVRASIRLPLAPSGAAA